MEQRARNDTGCGEDTDGDRQIVGGPLLFDIGGGQIGGNAADRKVVTGVFQCRLDPVLTLLDRAIGESDGGKGGQSGGKINFNIDDNGINSDQGTAEHLCKHGYPRSTTISLPFKHDKAHLAP